MIPRFLFFFALFSAGVASIFLFLDFFTAPCNEVYTIAKTLTRPRPTLDRRPLHPTTPRLLYNPLFPLHGLRMEPRHHPSSEWALEPSLCFLVSFGSFPDGGPISEGYTNLSVQAYFLAGRGQGSSGANWVGWTGETRPHIGVQAEDIHPMTDHKLKSHTIGFFCPSLSAIRHGLLP